MVVAPVRDARNLWQLIPQSPSGKAPGGAWTKDVLLQAPRLNGLRVLAFPWQQH
jgi:hypothetical protein